MLCLKYRTSLWNNRHFSGFIFRWAPQSLSNTVRELSSCSWNVRPITIISSRYGILSRDRRSGPSERTPSGKIIFNFDHTGIGDLKPCIK
jgi:hypothetical protein